MRAAAQLTGTRPWSDFLETKLKILDYCFGLVVRRATPSRHCLEALGNQSNNGDDADSIADLTLLTSSVSR